MAAVSRRIWWATWPGALALGLLSLVMVAITAVPLVALAVVESDDVPDTDAMSWDGPSVGLRVAWALAGIACLVVPAVVVFVARRKWLGWVLVLMALSAVVLGVGLSGLGVI